MAKRNALLFLIPFFLLASNCVVIKRNSIKPAYELPFEYINNFMIIEVVLNKTVPMNFIFDTGAQFTLLLDPFRTQLAKVQLEKRFPIIGSDRSQVLSAYRTNLVELSMGSIPTTTRKVMYLQDSQFDLQKYTTKKIHGILGADILLNTLFRINYQEQKIEFYKYRDFKKPDDYQTVNLFKQTSRPEVPISFVNSEKDTIPLRLLIDTGASISMILYENGKRGVYIPENVLPTRIADGLGGTIKGYMARTDGLKLGNSSFKDFIYHYQSHKDLVHSDSLGKFKQDGILGNQFLENFDIYYDMAFKKIHFQPYRKKVIIDKHENTTGIIIVMTGEYFNEPFIEQVLEGSPAHKAGVQEGWKIVSINGYPTAMMPSERLFDRIEAKPGKKIKLVLSNGEFEKTVHFVAEKLL